MPDPTYRGRALHSPLSLTRAALPRPLLQSRAGSALPTEGAGSPLHATHFRLRGFSTKLWPHARTSPEDSAALSTTPRGHPNQQAAGDTFVWTSCFPSTDLERSAGMHSLPLPPSDSLKLPSWLVFGNPPPAPQRSLLGPSELQKFMANELLVCSQTLISSPHI